MAKGERESPTPTIKSLLAVSDPLPPPPWEVFKKTSAGSLWILSSLIRLSILWLFTAKQNCNHEAPLLWHLNCEVTGVYLASHPASITPSQLNLRGVFWEIEREREQRRRKNGLSEFVKFEVKSLQEPCHISSAWSRDSERSTRARPLWTIA